jgi:transposase-like protein
MPIGIHTDPALKAEILRKIRDQGMSVTEASTSYGVHSKTIYGWLRNGVVNSDRSLVLELNRLRKENEQLYRLLGRATAEMQKSKR